ncbi:MAG: hypothetical protein HC886_00315 [Leptolyngbyaceae cyanobacterium SM1_1_3]|nr:hypothetical protein [Leptolyngbyaceae cyanobacterium SM1_1_3]NJM84757.1 hypothetical protein [Leptolyngbyaceae cyanobacterium RM2_2_21]NJN01977.1 hypothetical protein [Leptolyngbyaceae cyanobacterium RM1_1_2]NJO10128.1 hypothetical protein [Leptolyngbyaceae cyanobacterium SL_1_1]
MSDQKTDQLCIVEDLLVAVEPHQHEDQDVVLVSAKACLDLSGYHLSAAELSKLMRILKDLNAQLAESLQRDYPAASVVLEICSKPTHGD